MSPDNLKKNAGNNQLRLAVVGVGTVAVKQYLPELLQLGHSVAVLGRNLSKVTAAVANLDVEVLNDYEALVSWHPDVAFVLTTDSQHHVVLSELISRGVQRIFVEKPLVSVHGQAHVDEADARIARELLKRADEAHIDIAIGFNYRFFELTQRSLAIVSEREWGQLVGIDARAHYACWSHTIDLLQLFGGPIERLNAFEGPTPHGTGDLRAPDRVISFLTASGATGTLHGTGASSWNDDLLEITAQFERGRFRLTDLDGELLIIDEAAKRVETIRPSANGNRWERYDESFRQSIRAYLLSVQYGQRPSTSGEDGAIELSIEAAIRRSIDTGETVMLTSGEE